MKKALALTLLLLYGSSAGAEIFTWTDRGTRHYTNSIHEVPARFRSKVKVLDVPTGKKLAPTPAQLAGQTQPQPSDQPAGAPIVVAPAQPAPVAAAAPAPAAPATPAPAAQYVPPPQPASNAVSPVQQQVRAGRHRHRAPGGNREE